MTFDEYAAKHDGAENTQIERKREKVKEREAYVYRERLKEISIE